VLRALAQSSVFAPGAQRAFVVGSEVGLRDHSDVSKRIARWQESRSVGRGLGVKTLVVSHTALDRFPYFGAQLVARVRLGQEYNPQIPKAALGENLGRIR
jgi:hypothetical protein